MNKIRHTNRQGIVALLGVILGVGILSAGCDKQLDAAKEPTKPVTAKKAVTKAPAVRGTPVKTEEAPPAPSEAPASAMSTPVPTQPLPFPRASEADVLAAIEASADPFQLHALQEEYKQREEQSEVGDQAFASKWKSLTNGMKPQTLIEGLDFLAVNTKATGDKEYTFSFLFPPTANLPADHRLLVLAFVLPSNAPYLPEAHQKDLYSPWTGPLKHDPTSQWKPGEYRVVHLKKKIELIPYNLRLYLQTINEEGKMARVGEELVLGWQWDVLDERSFLSKIEACNDFATLHALAPAGPPMSAQVAQAVEKKWKALTAGMEPKTMIEGLDFLALDTKATGEKEYTFSLLLQATADVDVDYILTLFARMDPSHIKPGKPGTLQWNLPHGDWTSHWKAGEYHVVQYKAETEIIPLNISIFLQIEHVDPTSYTANRIELGWQAGIPE